MADLNIVRYLVLVVMFNSYGCTVTISCLILGGSDDFQLLKSIIANVLGDARTVCYTGDALTSYTS
jgi:hypothetical protein